MILSHFILEVFVCIETKIDLERLFHPKSIAVIGATPRKGKSWDSGNAYIAASIEQSFQGKIYPVHPKADTILGFKAYRSILDIPDDIDLAIFTIPSKAALTVMEECVAKGVKYAHLLTAGFSETGRPEHAELERKLVEIARKGAIRIVGPNCMGLYTPEGGLAFNEGFPVQAGSVSFFSQSGQLAGHFVRDGNSLQDLTYSMVVSFGNASDLQAHEFLNYFLKDGKTDIIGSYLEGLKNGRLFFNIARQVTPFKPLVIWKGGQTDGGSRAIQSHTAAMAGSLKIWQAMCRQAGIIQVHSMEEIIATVAALKRMMPPKGVLPKGVRVAIMGGAGGGSVTMTDMAEKNGLQVPHLSEKTIKTLETFVPLAGNSVKNPLDVFFNNDDHFNTLIRLLKEDPNIDAFIYNMRFGGPNQFRGLLELNHSIQGIVEAYKNLGKPMLIVLEQTGETEIDMLNREIASSLHGQNVATFPSFEIAAKVIANLSEYHDYLLSSKKCNLLIK